MYDKIKMRSMKCFRQKKAAHRITRERTRNFEQGKVKKMMKNITRLTKVLCLVLVLVVVMLGTLAACKKEEGESFHVTYPFKGKVVYAMKFYKSDYPDTYLLYVDTPGGDFALDMMLITKDTLVIPDDGSWNAILNGELVGVEVEGYSMVCVEGKYFQYPKLYILDTIALVEKDEE